MRSVRPLLAAVLLALAPATALAVEGATRELLRRSGLEAQLTQVEGAVRVAMLERLRGETDPRRVARLMDAAARAFAGGRLRATVERRLAALDRRSARAALAFLRSPAGRRTTRAEVAAFEPDVLAAARADEMASEEALSAHRRALLARLERAFGAGETRLALDLRLSAAMLEGALAARPELAAVAPAADAGELEGRRAELLAGYREAARRDDARAYRGLSDADLGRYVEFAESAAGRHYQAAVDAALIAALEEAGRVFGELLAGERAA